MTTAIKYILLAAVSLAVVSCHKEGPREICDYNVAVEYVYNRENTTNSNVLGEYIGSLTEYIFDGDGILYAMREVPADECEGGLVSQQLLPPGDYSLITWGNKTGINSVNDARVGITHRRDMELMPDNPFTPETDMQDNGDRLYYTYRTFSVAPHGISHVKAYMVHSHLVLKYRIVWKRAAQAPADTRDFYSEHTEIPSPYGFMPEFVFNGQGSIHDPAADPYEPQATERYLYIPTVYGKTQAGRILKNHRNDVRMNDYREVNGELVAYRLRDDTDLTIDLRSQSRGEIMRDVNLGEEFFRANGIALDRNLRQEFAVLITIDGGDITVSSLDIADWDEGQTIGF